MTREEGARGAAGEGLEQAKAALARGDLAAASRLAERCRGRTPRPAGLDAFRIELLERQGLLEEALAVARGWLRRVRRGAPRERVEASLALARLAWRAGRAREAQVHLERLRRLLRGPSRGRIEWSLLRANLAAEAGHLEAARQSLQAARADAEASGEGGDLVRVLHRLGTLEARAGRPSRAGAAYRAALAALQRDDEVDPRYKAVLLSNLATMEVWLGRHEEAAHLYRDALVLREHLPLERLNTEAALALLRRARGVRDEGFTPLVAEADRLGDLRLRAELRVYLIEELLGRGALGEAERAVDQARIALAELGGAEVILEAMVDVAEASAASSRGDRSALGAFEQAIRALEAAGALYFAARSSQRAALGAIALGEDRKALLFQERVASLCAPERLRLGAEAEAVVPLALVALDGGADARLHAAGCLARLGRARVLAELRRAGRGDLAERLEQEAPAPRPTGAAWRADGPDGPRWLTHEALRQLRAGAGVVLDLERRELFIAGEPRPLGRQRLLAPLLAHLAARAPAECALPELAGVVWQSRPSASVFAAIKMMIARARRFLGEQAGLLQTRRTPEGAVAYGLAEEPPFYVVRRVT